jgi:hypothetical protein
MKRFLIVGLFSILFMGSCRYYPQYIVKNDPKKDIFRVKDNKNKFNLEIKGYSDFSWLEKYSFFSVNVENENSVKFTVFADSMSLRSKYFTYRTFFGDEMVYKHPHLLTILPKKEGMIEIVFEVDQLSTPYQLNYLPLDEEVTLKFKIVKNIVDTIDIEATFIVAKP